MKIDNSTFTTPPVRTNAPPQKSAENASRATESVNISAATSVVKNTEKPPVNESRIQEIKEAISQGRFKINPEAIADGLIQTARDLVNSQRKA